MFGFPLGVWMALVSPRCMWFGAFLFVPLVAVNYWTFLHGRWLNFTVPAVTLTAKVLLVSLYRSLFEEKEKRRARGFRAVPQPGSDPTPAEIGRASCRERV